jgi:two-component system, LuxR family, response regulator FixJ
VAEQARKPLVFVVESDDSVRRSLGRLIRSEGFEVRLYASAEPFLAEVGPTPGACVILDVGTPRTDGLSVQAELKARNIEMPVILLSAKDNDAVRRMAKKGGARFFFRKPVDARTLIDAIDWAVNSGDAPGAE